MEDKLHRYAIFARDGAGSYIFFKTAKSYFEVKRAIRETGFQAWIDNEAHIIDDIIDLDDTEVAR